MNVERYFVEIAINHAVHDSEIVVPICRGPIVEIARTFNVRDRSDGRMVEWAVARFWFDGFQTWALLRRRFDH